MRPIKFEKAIVDEIQKHLGKFIKFKNESHYYSVCQITGFYYNHDTGECYINLCGDNILLYFVLSNYVFLDGTPMIEDIEKFIKR